MNVSECNLLVMFSGGLDSTGLLYKLFKDNKYKIHVHHMNLINKEKRNEAEKIAVNKILEYFNNFDFYFSESTHEYPEFNGNFFWDGDISSFISANIANCNKNIKFVAYGRTASDNMSADSIDRINRSNKIFSIICKAQKIYPIEKFKKIDIFNELPDELKKITWSCRTPSYNEDLIIPCKKCKTCHEMKKEGIIHHSLIK